MSQLSVSVAVVVVVDSAKIKGPLDTEATVVADAAVVAEAGLEEAEEKERRSSARQRCRHSLRNEE